MILYNDDIILIKFSLLVTSSQIAVLVANNACDFSLDKLAFDVEIHWYQNAVKATEKYRKKYQYKDLI